jgi:squalene-hopene/tetraprenyl-beta-curcumene cyclase
MERATDHLLSLQHEYGYWWAELESNVTITAEHIFLRHILGIPDAGETARAARYIRAQQREDGTWANWHDGPPELSTMIEAYLALKLAGIPAEEPSMVRARLRILAGGGVENARVFTKIWLAMLGEWDWRAVPMLPPEFVLLPSWSPMSIYSFACWARQTIVPMSIILTARPVVPLPDAARIGELFVRDRGPATSSPGRTRPGLLPRVFAGADRVLHALEKSPWKPLRRRALAAAERWILARQEEDGSWGGIQPPWVYSLIALHLRGHALEGDGPVARGFQGFYGPTGFAIDDGEMFHLQSCLSPVWDTGLAAMALRDAGVPRQHPALVRASRWLVDEQVLAGGDWQLHCAAPPGGWAFEFANDGYPDTDDTAVVAMALAEDSDTPEIRDAVDRALRWLLGMQSDNGGWGAFDRNNTRRWPRAIPFCDFGEVIDPPSVDVTGHVLECLGRFGCRLGEPAVDRAVAFIRREQDEDGAWFGRWGVNLTYGIGSVIPGLRAVGVREDAPELQRAVRWLLEHQNPDGGWGERIEGYDDPRSRGRGPSTPSQSAWALLALLAAGRTTDRAVQSGIEYLLASQTAEGGWEEPQFTGTGFPTDFMIRYHLYRDVFPLMALGRYRRKQEEGR